MAIRTEPKLRKADRAVGQALSALHKAYERTPTTSEELFASKPVLDFVIAGNALLSPKSGRPHSGKQVVSLRLDPDVIEKFRATGHGWQARINEILRKA